MKWLILISLILTNVFKEHTPLVKIDSGLIRGRISDDGKFYQYFGIPYGTVDERNRFQAPLPAPKWDGVMDAINENIKCTQKLFNTVVIGTENCLKLNIYTPVKKTKILYPVMVYIHGGCFMEGSGTSHLYGGDNFVENDVVFITINYRLSVEGFLCLGIKEAPGNAGLKDQIAALKWIKKNIKAFSGDPDNVTLFGESAGATSTSMLILSPAAKGLFHKAILQSGASIVPWGLQSQPIKTARNLAKELGYFGNDVYRIYDVLSNKTAKELLYAIKDRKYRGFVTSTTLFSPCIENEIPGVEAVITKYPTDIIQSGNYSKMPMIIGYNDKEGIYLVAANFGNSVKEFDPYDLLQEDLKFPNEAIKNSTTQEMAQIYFKNNNGDMIMNMVDLYSDLHVKYPVIVESQLYTMTSDRPIYYYLFKYSGLNNNAKLGALMPFSPGASHADELFYLFKSHIIPLPTPYFEHEMINRMVTMWTNFAKYSDPTPTTSKLLPIRWQPSQVASPRALIIDRRLTTGPLWKEEDISFWNKTYTKYRRKDIGFQNRSFNVMLNFGTN